MALSTIRVTVGRVFLVAGVLVLLFIPYLLWGTGLITARAQADLRQQFAAAEHLHHERTDLHPATPAPGPPVVASNMAAPSPGSPVGVISIPKISLSMVVVEGTDADQLRSGPGHYPGTPLPGEAGNAAIAGHRTTYLHPFYNLNELVPGDPIDIVTVQGIFEYHVVSSQAVDPTDVAVVAPTPTPTLTLTTCTPRYSASQRLVVQATLVADVLTGTKAPATPATPVTTVGRTPKEPAAPLADPEELVGGHRVGSGRGRPGRRPVGPGSAPPPGPATGRGGRWRGGVAGRGLPVLRRAGPAPARQLLTPGGDAE